MGGDCENCEAREQSEKSRTTRRREIEYFTGAELGGDCGNCEAREQSEKSRTTRRSEIEYFMGAELDGDCEKCEAREQSIIKPDNEAERNRIFHGRRVGR